MTNTTFTNLTNTDQTNTDTLTITETENNYS